MTYGIKSEVPGLLAPWDDKPPKKFLSKNDILKGVLQVGLLRKDYKDIYIAVSEKRKELVEIRCPIGVYFKNYVYSNINLGVKDLQRLIAFVNIYEDVPLIVNKSVMIFSANDAKIKLIGDLEIIIPKKLKIIQ